MNKLLPLIVLSLVATFAMPASAADNKQNTNKQNTKMSDCQAQAGEKKLEGKDRQNFVNQCLKAKPDKAQSKMAECNAKTKGMSKDEAAKARSECMKAT
ncbi:MAG TPA: PsiF family protein [Casimicrobiaceae bacterium]|nr:PsiF family protein [Casimicrobiaceae bacterium]